jgi:hypothetical protein
MHGFEIISWLEDSLRRYLAVETPRCSRRYTGWRERALIIAEWGVTKNGLVRATTR